MTDLDIAERDRLLCGLVYRPINALEQTVVLIVITTVTTHVGLRD